MRGFGVIVKRKRRGEEKKRWHSMSWGQNAQQPIYFSSYLVPCVPSFDGRRHHQHTIPQIKMSNTYQLAHLAYLKIILHAAKYPSSLVNGVLVGSLSGSEIIISDCVPLLHHWTSLSPSMEIGLEMAEYHACSKGLRIVGYYQGNERLQDGDLSNVGIQVANSIKSRFPQAVVLMIDNEKLNGPENALKTLVSASDSTWSVAESSDIMALQRPTSPSDAKKAVQEGAFDSFGDFDGHLEDVTVDWLTNSKAVTGWA